MNTSFQFNSGIISLIFTHRCHNNSSYYISHHMHTTNYNTLINSFIFNYKVNSHNHKFSHVSLCVFLPATSLLMSHKNVVCNITCLSHNLPPYTRQTIQTVVLLATSKSRIYINNGCDVVKFCLRINRK